MLMNSLDVFLQKNPLYSYARRKMLEQVITRFYRDYLPLPPGKSALEIGCGSGAGSRLVMRYFKPHRLAATDLDQRLLDAAKKAGRDGRITYEVGDACSLRYRNGAFDAVFDFGVIHHIPNWRDCIRELYRVTRKGGRIFIYDVPIESFNSFHGLLLRAFTIHPYKEMFHREEFISAMEKAGFTILRHDSYRASLIYFVIVAEK